MSSHHVVREKQEPALLIMSLSGFDEENFGQLLEWSPTVIVDEAVYEQVEEAGIKIDAVVTSNKEFAVQHSTRLILTSGSPLADALKFLVGEQYHAVNVIDTTFSLKDYALFVEHISLTIFSEGKKIFTVRPGFSKWQVGGQIIELMHEVQHLKASGVDFLDEHLLVTQKDGFYCLSFDQPFAFIAEDL